LSYMFRRLQSKFVGFFFIVRCVFIRLTLISLTVYTRYRRPYFRPRAFTTQYSLYSSFLFIATIISYKIYATQTAQKNKNRLGKTKKKNDFMTAHFRCWVKKNKRVYKEYIHHWVCDGVEGWRIALYNTVNNFHIEKLHFKRIRLISLILNGNIIMCLYISKKKLI